MFSLAEIASNIENRAPDIKIKLELIMNPNYMGGKTIYPKPSYKSGNMLLACFKSHNISVCGVAAINLNLNLQINRKLQYLACYQINRMSFFSPSFPLISRTT